MIERLREAWSAWSESPSYHAYRWKQFTTMAPVTTAATVGMLILQQWVAAAIIGVAAVAATLGFLSELWSRRNEARR